MEACTSCINEEFRSEQAALGYDRPTDFLTSQWPVPARGYVIYRVVVALAITGWVLSDGAYETTTYYDGAVWKWFIFATNWSFLLLAFSSIFQAITCCIYHWRQHWIIDPQFPRTMPVVLKLQWIILNMSYNSALVVTLSYWSFIAFFDHSQLLLSDMSRLKHTMNTVYVLGDLMLGGSRIRILHMFFTVTLGSVYALFNAIYFLNDGTINSGERGVHSSHYAYSFMNWSKPVEAIITCVLCVFQAIVSQLILALLTRLRVFIYRKAYGEEAEVRVESEMQNIVSESTSYSAIDDMEVKVDPK